MNVEDNMTEIGKLTYKLFEKYNLVQFYQFEMGNLIIYPADFSVDIQKRIMQFLKNNPNYILGFEENYYYVSRIDEAF